MGVLRHDKDTAVDLQCMREESWDRYGCLKT